MRYLNRLVLAAAIVCMTGPSASAQQGSVITSGGQSLGSLSGTGGLAGGGTGGIGGGGGGGGGGGSLGGSQLSGTQLQQMPAAPNITAPTGQSGGALDTSNVFSGYFANPYYQGLITAPLNQVPGGFGTPLYGTSTGTATGTSRTRGIGGVTNNNSTRNSSLGGSNLGGNRGGVGGIGGIGGVGGVNSNYGVVIPISVQLTYPAIARFPTAPVASTQLQNDITGMLARATAQIANPNGVQVITSQGNNVILRGAVQNEEEARLVEGLVRLTPGVRIIQNELTFPRP